MLLLDADNARDYLQAAGRIGPGEPVEVSVLAGGVSNQVLYVARPTAPGQDFVLKQARGQLRVADPWFCTVERIWREVEVLRICQSLLHNPAAGASPLRATTPQVLWEDRNEYLFAMTAAPRNAPTWKALLLRGEFSAELAQASGDLLGRLHAASWHNPQVAAALDDRQIYDELRLDPYYRTLAARVPDFAEELKQLIAETLSHRHALVHADFSPKNLLVAPGELLLVDFETGHYGDPAFDLGFFLTHLALKTVYHRAHHREMLRLIEAFWAAYLQALAQRVDVQDRRALEARAVRHLAACMWARLDGKSPVEYLTDPAQREFVRGLCRAVFRAPPAQLAEIWEQLREAGE